MKKIQAREEKMRACRRQGTPENALMKWYVLHEKTKKKKSRNDFFDLLLMNVEIWFWKLYSEDENMLLPAVKRRTQVSILMNTVFLDGIDNFIPSVYSVECSVCINRIPHIKINART